nr:MAG: putative phosphoesterase WSV147 [White spot syndrome virus]
MAISGPGVSGRRYCLMATLSPSLPLLKRAHVYIMTVPHLIQTITTTTTTMEEHLSFNKPSPENGVVFFDFSDNTSMSNMVDNIRHRLPMDKKFSSKALLLASTPIPSDEQLSTKVNKAIFSHRETIVLSKALKIVVTGLYVDGEYVDDVICLYPEKHTLNGILRYVVHLNMMLMDKAEDADEIRCGLIPLGRGFNREAFKFVDPVIPCAGYNILNGYHPDNGHQISPSSTQPQVQRRCAVKQMYKQINGMFEVVKQFSIKHNNRIFTFKSS